MSKTFFDESHIEPIRNMLDAGGSYRSIAAQYGCDHHTVRDFVRKHLPVYFEARCGQYNSSGFTAMPGMKILVLDIETIAGTERRWHSRQRFGNPDMIIDDTRLFCFAAKWLGDDKTEFRSVFHDGRAGMVTRAHELLTEADAVITFNGDNFDLPHMNLEFLRNGMAPPRPYKSIDLIKTVRRRFRFYNNKLQRISITLGIGEKVEHEGWPLWDKCERGEKAAWKRMRDYNVEDVNLTERLYLQLRPWLEGHPSYAAFYGDLRCVNCGSENLAENIRLYHAKTRSYALYQCDDCGKWTRARAAEPNLKAEVTECAIS
jgi:DNA polymerase elongation subunit (family B)